MLIIFFSVSVSNYNIFGSRNHDLSGFICCTALDSTVDTIDTQELHINDLKKDSKWKKLLALLLVRSMTGQIVCTFGILISSFVKLLLHKWPFAIEYFWGVFILCYQHSREGCCLGKISEPKNDFFIANMILNTFMYFV